MRPELERGKCCALVARACFIDPDVHRYPRVVRHVERRKRSPPINAGKPTGVTVREDIERSAGVFGKSADDFQAVHANQAALLDVGIADCGSFPKRCSSSLLRLNFRQHIAHSRQRPGEIDRRRTRRLQYSGCFGEVRVRGVRACGERHAICRGCSDQRRTTHHHGADRVRRIGQTFEVNGVELERQTRLINYPDGPGFGHPDRAEVRARYSHASTPIRLLTAKLGALEPMAGPIVPPAWRPAAVAIRDASPQRPAPVRAKYPAISPDAHSRLLRQLSGESHVWPAPLSLYRAQRNGARMTTRVSNTRNPVAGPLPGMPIPDNWPEGRGAITRSEETSGTRSKHRCNPQRVGRDAFTKPRNCAGMNWSHPQGVNGKREYSYGREHRENKLGRQAQQRKHNKRQPRPMPRPRLQLLARRILAARTSSVPYSSLKGWVFIKKLALMDNALVLFWTRMVGSVRGDRCPDQKACGQH